MEKSFAKATFAAGCFWGVEEAFRTKKGVTTTTVGYSGGHTPHATYEQVCGGSTGHAESVEVEYDPAEISYEKLLAIFWECHNPTTKNRQGPDIGSQYRSVIFYHTPQQKALAAKSKAELEKSGKWKDSVVTEIVAAAAFCRAEEYHQKYFLKNGGGACHYG